MGNKLIKDNTQLLSARNFSPMLNQMAWAYSVTSTQASERVKCSHQRYLGLDTITNNIIDMEKICTSVQSP